jgi:dethiobiotin synthetase
VISPLFITGTDTHVGKTYVAAGLIRAARAAGIDCVGFKPICCGERDDAERLHAASAHVLPLNDVNPVWYRTPAAPYTASMIENRPPDLALVEETFHRLCATHRALVVEGAGGWRVPITQELAFSDLAVQWNLPVIVVAANRLGALNHTLLTVEAIQHAGLRCLAVVLNQAAPPESQGDPAAITNAGILETLIEIPVISLSHGADVAESALTALVLNHR